MVPIVTLLLGVFFGPALEKVASPWFSSANLPYVLFLISAVMYLIVSTLIMSSYADIRSSMFRLETRLGPVVRVVPYDEAKLLLEKRTLEARDEILVLSNYKRYDWQRRAPVALPGARSTASEARAKAYRLTQQKLRDSAGMPDFKFCKIVQVPAGNALTEALAHDPAYADDCRVIVDIGAPNPQRVALRTSTVEFQNTFVIIDKRFLYLEFDQSHPTNGHRMRPFVMLIEDDQATLVNELRELYRRIEATSHLVQASELPRVPT